jgi:hypothetical protein
MIWEEWTTESTLTLGGYLVMSFIVLGIPAIRTFVHNYRNRDKTQ